MIKGLLLTFAFALSIHDLSAQSPSVLDVVVVGRDTVVASTNDMRIMVSYDGGKSWLTTVRELMKSLGTDGKRIWGIDSWIGIHEKDYSRLFYSDNFGKTWKQIELDPDKFFAMELLQIDGKLFIVDAFGSLWQHTNLKTESAKNWRKITSKQTKYAGEGLFTAAKNKYAVLSRDSLYLFDLKHKTTTTQEAFSRRIRAFCFLDDHTLTAIDNEGVLFIYSISEKTAKEVSKLSGYKYFNNIFLLDKKIYIIGSGNDAVKDYVLFSILNRKWENDFVGGLTGLDQDISYIDKYKRIWCGTTDGLFVLAPDENLFRKVL